MKFIKRVYVAGVGYTAYLTKSPIKIIEPGAVQEKITTTTIGETTVNSLVKGASTIKPAANTQADFIYLDHLKGSTKTSVEKGFVYNLNLKIGFSDLKQIDLTPYLTEDIEILVVGKEIITTPGYQELATEIESLITASEIKSIIIIRGENKLMVNSLAALIRNLRPYSVYKGIGLRLEGDPLVLKTFVKSKHK